MKHEAKITIADGLPDSVRDIVMKNIRDHCDRHPVFKNTVIAAGLTNPNILSLTCDDPSGTA